MQKKYLYKDGQQARADFSDAQTMYVYIQNKKDGKIILSDTRIEPPKGYKFITGKVNGRHI
jgi:hypothetical protein